MKTRQYNKRQPVGNGRSNKKSNRVISQDTEIQNREHRRTVREMKESTENMDWTDPQSWAQSYLNFENLLEDQERDRNANYDYHDSFIDEEDDAPAFAENPRTQKEV